MITETQTRVIVLQLTDEMLTQLKPYMAGLDITTTPHREWAYQEVYEQGQFAGYEQVEHRRQRLTMRGEVYDALTERVAATAVAVTRFFVLRACSGDDPRVGKHRVLRAIRISLFPNGNGRFCAPIRVWATMAPSTC